MSKTATMGKIFQLTDFGLDKLKATDLEVQQPKGTQVLVRMKAASLNYRDLMVAKGLYSRKLKLPLVPLSDGAGEIVAIGDSVTRFKIGDRVFPIFMQDWVGGQLNIEAAKSALGGAIDGVLREYGLFEQHGLVSIPQHLSYEEAATLPCAAVTAWNALFSHGSLQAGQSVLVLGSGGVSVFALQFAKLAGARVIATSSSDQKLARLRELGADELINYKSNPEWDTKVLELTGGVGVDYVVEVGGPGTLDRSIKSVRMGGTLSLIGVLAGVGQVNPMPIFMKGVTAQGIFVGSREMAEAMTRAISLHKLKPVIDRTFKAEQITEALNYMETGSHFGKIVLTI